MLAALLCNLDVTPPVSNAGGGGGIKLRPQSYHRDTAGGGQRKESWIDALIDRIAAGEEDRSTFEVLREVREERALTPEETARIIRAMVAPRVQAPPSVQVVPNDDEEALLIIMMLEL